MSVFSASEFAVELEKLTDNNDKRKAHKCEILGLQPTDTSMIPGLNGMGFKLSGFFLRLQFARPNK